MGRSPLGCAQGPGVLGALWPRSVSPLRGRSTPTCLLACPQLEKKQALPPFQPQITDDYGLDNFDTQFTSEPVQLTPDDE